MAFFDIADDELPSLDGQVAIITGASSGIGLATTQLFLSKGAKVIGADLQAPAENISSSNFNFHKTDVTSWSDLCDLYRSVHNKHNRIDIVFANAGIGTRANFLHLESDGERNLLEPSRQTFDINLIAVGNQIALAAHYMRRQEPQGGNIVLTASCTGYQRFGVTDYVPAKHGVIGLLRSFSQMPDFKPIRINAVAPSWTLSGLVTLPPQEFEKLGIKYQEAHAVAKSVVFLAAGEGKHGQCLYSCGGRYVEMEEPMQRAMLEAIGKTGLAEEDERRMVMKHAEELAKGAGD